MLYMGLGDSNRTLPVRILPVVACSLPDKVNTPLEERTPKDSPLAWDSFDPVVGHTVP